MAARPERLYQEHLRSRLEVTQNRDWQEGWGEQGANL